MGIDLASVKGTGPGGRITKEDVETAATKTGEQTSAEADAYGLVERYRSEVFGARSLSVWPRPPKRVAEVTIWEDADITELEQVRARERKVAEEKE